MGGNGGYENYMCLNENQVKLHEVMTERAKVCNRNLSLYVAYFLRLIVSHCEMKLRDFPFITAKQHNHITALLT